RDDGGPAGGDCEHERQENEPAQHRVTISTVACCRVSLASFEVKSPPMSRFGSLRRLAGFPAQAPVSVGTSYPSIPPPPVEPEPAPAPAAPEDQLWSGRLRPGEEVGSGATATVIRAVD